MIIINRLVIAENIKKKRKEKGITQEELAEKMFKGQGHISAIENAKNNSVVDLEVLNNIAQALDCKIEDFCYVEENKYAKRN